MVDRQQGGLAIDDDLRIEVLEGEDDGAVRGGHRRGRRTSWASVCRGSGVVAGEEKCDKQHLAPKLPTPKYGGRLGRFTARSTGGRGAIRRVSARVIWVWEWRPMGAGSGAG